MATTTKTKAPAINLFATGTKVKEAATKKTDKQIFKAPDLSNQCQEFLELKNKVEADTAKMKMLEGEIKTAGKDLYLKQYTKNKLKPESFKIQDATGAACLFMVMDKYTVVDEAKVEAFKALEYDDLLSSKVVYTINAEMVEKYGEILSSLIINSKEIADEDKGQLIAGELTYSVAKGSIERLMQFEAPERVFDLINPIVALKK